jgi:hypothetical protein
MATAKNSRPLGHLRQVADGAGQSCGDRADENVAISHVRQFMAQYAGELALIENAANPGRDRDCGMVRIPTRGKCVRCFLR